MAKRRRGRWFFRLLGLAVIAGVVFVGVSAFRVGPEVDIAIESDLPGIGNHTEVTVTVAEPKRGLGLTRVELIQGERTSPLGELESEPLPPWKFWGPRTRQGMLRVAVGRNDVEGLTEGEATIRVTSERAGAWLRWPQPSVAELKLPVKLRPPTVQVGSAQTYVTQGGCEAVVYTVGASSVKDGVQAGEWFFPGYPLPGGGDRERFALFAAPWDVGTANEIRLVAEDDVRNRVEVPFIPSANFKPSPPRRDTIPVSDDFMARVVPAILSQTPELEDKGDLLQNYLQINNELRERNRATLRELAARSRPEFLWTRAFEQMPNSKVTSTFADRRTYVYQGRHVDEQTHLGFDLASTQRAEVPASNAGVVLVARYFGIYGNAVVLDHGYGLMTLYGHLSSIAVEEGQQVQQGQVLGRSGATGLAGGDHLHFTVLLQGLPVNPREWWDAAWIRNRIGAKLDGAFPFSG